MSAEEEKKKMLSGLLARAKEHMDATPYLRRLSAVMRALRAEMQRRAAAGSPLTPLGAYTDDSERVSFLDFTTREHIVARLRDMAAQGTILTGGFCVASDEAGAVEIHGEDRGMPNAAIVAIEPLQPPADDSQPLRGRKKKVRAVIFVPPG